MFPIFVAILILVFGALLWWLSDTPKNTGVKFEGSLPGKALIVVFSESAGQNTRRVAVWLHEATGAEILPLEPVEPYPDSYAKCLLRGRKEIKAGVQPALSTSSQCDLSEYEIIFLGTPVWFGTYAPPVKTFLAQNDYLKGKAVFLFATHGGGGLSHTLDDLKTACPEARFSEPFVLTGPNAIERKIGRTVSDKHSPECVAQWLNECFPTKSS